MSGSRTLADFIKTDSVVLKERKKSKKHLKIKLCMDEKISRDKISHDPDLLESKVMKKENPKLSGNYIFTDIPPVTSDYFRLSDQKNRCLDENKLRSTVRDNEVKDVVSVHGPGKSFSTVNMVAVLKGPPQKVEQVYQDQNFGFQRHSNWRSVYKGVGRGEMLGKKLKECNDPSNCFTMDMMERKKQHCGDAEVNIPVAKIPVPGQAPASATWRTNPCNAPIAFQMQLLERRNSELNGQKCESKPLPRYNAENCRVNLSTVDSDSIKRENFKDLCRTDNLNNKHSYDDDIMSTDSNSTSWVPFDHHSFDDFDNSQFPELIHFDSTDVI